VLSTSSTIPTAHPTTYVPRGANFLRHIFHGHFHAFADAYDSLYPQDYGKFRLERISHVVDKFESCGGKRGRGYGGGRLIHCGYVDYED
jgi:hypothetical protein